MATTLAGYRSWFNSTVYYVIEELAKMETDIIFSLFGEIDYNVATGDTVNFTGAAFGGYAPFVAPGGQIPESNMTEGDQLAKTFLSFKDRMVVEWETILHDKLSLVKDKTSALVQKCINSPALVFSRALLDAADASTVTLPNGSTTYATTCADGQNLAATAHTVPGSSSSFRNTTTGAGALSDSEITNAIQIGNQNIVNDDGIVAPWNPDTLIIPRVEAMVRKALEITKSDKVTLSANNTVNVYSGGRFNVVVLNHSPRNALGAYNTAASALYRWAVADSSMLKRAIKYAWAARPQENVVGKFQNRENLDSTIVAAGRIVFGFPRWQGIVYSLSSTAPTLG